MKQIPQIQKFMTDMPHTIEKNASLKNAFEIMNEFDIRHLPVMNEGRLVGLVTDRDVKLASSFKGSETITVGGVMSEPPYSVVPEAPLDLVLREMAEKKYGCAVVTQDNGKVVGIFTANDGLRVLADQMDVFYKQGSLDSHVRTNL